MSLWLSAHVYLYCAATGIPSVAYALYLWKGRS